MADDQSGVQQKVLCNWGMTLKQSSAVHIQALVSADVILPGSSSKLRLLVINLASVPGGQLVNSPTAQSLERQTVKKLFLTKKSAFTISSEAYSSSFKQPLKKYWVGVQKTGWLILAVNHFDKDVF